MADWPSHSDRSEPGRLQGPNAFDYGDSGSDVECNIEAINGNGSTGPGTIDRAGDQGSKKVLRNGENGDRGAGSLDAMADSVSSIPSVNFNTYNNGKAKKLEAKAKSSYGNGQKGQRAVDDAGDEHLVSDEWGVEANGSRLDGDRVQSSQQNRDSKSSDGDSKQSSNLNNLSDLGNMGNLGNLSNMSNLSNSSQFSNSSNLSNLSNLANEDDDDDGGYDLSSSKRGPLRASPVILHVSSPQKMLDGSAAFVTYLVSSQHDEFHQPERVRRRFSEFVRLYTQLCAEFPTCAVPPLPDRSRLEYIARDRFAAEFTSKRAASLERFLFRIAQHPDLARSRSLVAFLAPREGAAGFGGSRRASSAGSINSFDGASPNLNAVGDPSMFDTISDSLINAFAKVKYQSKEMTDARERADRFEHNVSTVDKAVVRVARGHHDLALDFDEMRRQALRLAKVEPSLQNHFEHLASTAKVLSESTASLRQDIDSQFAGALRDMTHYVQALKGMLKQREQRQIDYEALVEYLSRTKTDLAASEQGVNASTSSYLRTKVNDLRGVDKEQARAARIQKLRVRIKDLSTEVDKAKQVSDEFEVLAKREVQVFEHIEQLELQSSLQGLTDKYIEYFQRVLKECRAIEQQLSPSPNF